MAAEIEVQEFGKAVVAVDEIGEKDLVQRAIERIDSIADGIAEPADIDQRAGIGGTEAFGEGQIGLENPEDRSDVDAGGRAHELQATVAATRRIDKAVVAERANDLSQMVLGCIAGSGDIAFADRDMRIDRTEHQRSDGQIGSHRNAHRCPPPRMAVTICLEYITFQGGY